MYDFWTDIEVDETHNFKVEDKNNNLININLEIGKHKLVQNTIIEFSITALRDTKDIKNEQLFWLVSKQNRLKTHFFEDPYEKPRRKHCFKISQERSYREYEIDEIGYGIQEDGKTYEQIFLYYSHENFLWFKGDLKDFFKKIDNSKQLVDMFQKCESIFNNIISLDEKASSLLGENSAYKKIGMFYTMASTITEMGFETPSDVKKLLFKPIKRD